MATRSSAASIEVIADSDTRWKWGAALAGRLAPDAAVRGTLLRGPATPTERQLRDVGWTGGAVRRASIAEVIPALAATDAQVVVLACVGGGVQAFLHALGRAWTGRAVRPVVVTGYVGLVYERVADGLLLRAGADVVLANSAVDAERFRAVYAAVGVDPASVAQSALPFLGGAPHDRAAAGRERPYTVTFVTQPGVPATRAERRYALEQVIEHAVRHPDRHVIVKLRARVGERTTHVEPHHYTTLLPATEIPANVEFAYGPMAAVLDRTDLCVTVSSTAALEAMHRAIPTAILTDFGIRESLGNPAFLGSGALSSWPALHAGAAPATDPGWAARNGVHELDPYGGAERRVASLVAAGADRPPLRAWYSAETAGAYLTGLLARHGLAPDGTPRDAGVGAPVRPSVSRRALRASVRGVYGLGVRRVEPRLKRWAQL